MKKIWLGVGAAVIVILLLLQTKFNIYTRVEDSGYAADGNIVKQMLMSNPEEIKDAETVPYYPFEALDYVYKRGGSFYMGENKKTEVDLSFPFYINDGAGILFMENSGTLFDLNFEEAEVYPGLMVSERIAYNQGRERADATEYLFYGLAGGLFMNLDALEYEDRGEQRQIAMNSIIYFCEGYFTYFEPEGGAGVYQVCRSIADDSIISINGRKCTYRELLLKLHIISEDKEKSEKNPEEKVAEISDTEIMTLPGSETEEITQKDKNTEVEQPEATEKKAEKKTKKNSKPKEKQTVPQSQPAARPRPATEKDKKPSGGQSRPGGNTSGDQGSMGVRPDEMRPDKKPSAGEGEEPVIGYKKPVVEITGTEEGVYRLMVGIKVEDEARRLHPLRRVQFEFYEIADSGKEILAYRTFAGSTQTVTAGNGAIKPDTEYRVNAYFTYYDEFGQMVVESLMDDKLHTKSLDTLSSIKLADRNIDVYYDNRLELPGVKYEAGISDEEAVYGINRSGGLILTIEGRGTQIGFHAEAAVDAAGIRVFKKGAETLIKSMPTLKANSKYSYKLEAYDYFGNKLELLNNTGDFETCKSRPSGALEVIENKIGDVRMQVNMTDYDKSAVPGDNADNYNIYLAFSSEKNLEINPINKQECDAYLLNGGKTKDGRIDFVYKFSQDEYKKYLGGEGSAYEINIDKVIKAEALELNKKYYAYLFCDYNLNNGAGVVEFGEIANLTFTSASLSSLGDIYVKTDISNLTAHSAVIAYTLNKDRTNDRLESLLSDVKFSIMRGNGEEQLVDSCIEFDSEAMTVFTGYDHTSEPPAEVANGSVMMDASFFQGTEEGKKPLKSMTDYVIKPEIWATYNGVKYPMNVVLTKSSFKTMKEAAQVEVTNLLLAAGNLRFDVQVKDPDGAIIGNSGHKVVMNLYQQDGTFIKAIRIPKNTEEPYPVEFKNLDPEAKFKLTFIAVEYNEGYTNTTYESNKILKEMLLSDSLNLSGSIKLQNIIGSASDTTKLQANTQVILSDKDKVLQTLPYFIQVKKNGVDVTSSGGYPASYTVSKNEYYNNNIIFHSIPFIVDKGNNTYTLSLYVYVNGQKLELDTLTFTSEQTVEGIGSAEDFIWKIKNNGGAGKYVVTGDISLESDKTYANPDKPSEKAAPKRIVEIFYGELDFQGYTLSYNYKTSGSQLFFNLASKSKISNMVLDIKAENYGSASYGSGIFSYMNYGLMSDISVHYKGGAEKNNQYYGILCRFNAASGVIENFTVENTAEDGLVPFTAGYEAGLVCSANLGTVRNGYVYGDDILTDVVTPSRAGVLNIGGIVGRQSATGRLYNVYSLVNIIVASPERSSNGKTAVTAYGSVVGNAGGRLSNIYGIGQSFYSSPYNGTSFDNARGPVAGTESSRSSQVYYWNESNAEYNQSLYQDRIGLESLYDYSWQAQLLGSQFDTSNVEVGYYPHVIQSEAMPPQPFIPLPDRLSAGIVELMSSALVEYTENGEAAVVEFRFSNINNVDIQEIEIENLTTVINRASISSADGYTTLRATVSEATRFCSGYEIKGVRYKLNGGIKSITFSPAPILAVDFYQNIYTAQDWYDHVVCEPTENARLQADIDFTGVDESRIYVGKNYTGKLDGNKYRGNTSDEPAGYMISNLSMKTKSNVFNYISPSGEIKNLCVNNAIFGSPSNPKGNIGFIKDNYGIVDNVHMKDIAISGYGQIGAVAGGSYSVSEIRNCSVSGITIEYREPGNTNTNGRIGGIVGYASEAYINNCYVRDLDMAVEDIKNCEGAGGIIGLGNSSIVDSVYATGDISVRGMNVGGIIGYYSASEANSSITNVLARVNITTYQDNAGGIVGTTGITSILNARNNMSGVAFGNISGRNPNAEWISFTLGYYAGSKVSFFGSEVQAYNGMTGHEKDDNTLELLSYEEIIDPGTYTQKAGLDNSYDYSKVTEGMFPVLYYADTTVPLPFQTDTPLSMVHVKNNEIEISNAECNEADRYIYMDLINPEGYDVTSVTIENLKYTYNTADSSKARIYADYLPEKQQEHWQDSYLLTELTYQKMGDDGKMIIGKADYSLNPVRIPLTLFCDIRNCDDWNTYININNNYGNYENYRIVNDISFTGVVPTTNAKIGRLRGETNRGEAVISNINIGPGYGTLKGKKENFIFRLNSEMSNLVFKDCEINSSERDCVGLIGTSAADVTQVDFENVTVNSKTNGLGNVGIIGFQVGGSFKDITLKNIKIGQNAAKNLNNSGAVVGYCTGGTLYTNITGEQIYVKGYSCVGGIVGTSKQANYDTIALKDIKVTGEGNGYMGGVVGMNDTPRAVTNNVPYFWNVSVTGTPVYDENGNIIDSTTVIGVVDDMPKGLQGHYVGGIAGYSLGYCTGWDKTVSKAKPILVDGVIVKGYGSYIGGAFGRVFDACNIMVKNTLITTKEIPNQMYYSVGGISGYQNYNTAYNTVENTVIDVKDHARVGLLIGQKPNDGNITYCNVVNSSLKAERTLATGTYTEIGGLIGRMDASATYCGVVNSDIAATSKRAGSGYSNVGGIAGYAANTVNRCFYYAKPAAGSSAAEEKYKITGCNNVGGISGWQETGSITTCYSNGNVVAEGHTAGGFTGVYQNGYSTSVIGDKAAYSYSTVSLNYSLFAGTVHADKYAGGAIGRNQMKYNDTILAAHRANGGRTTSTEAGYKSGIANESAYTYRNLVLAEKVTSNTPGTAHAFSGIQDGFEGKANGNKVTKDNTALDKASRTYFWEGMKVGGTEDADRLYYAENADAPECAKNSGTYRFKCWNKNEYSVLPKEEAPSDSYNVRAVSTQDIKNLKMFRSLGWLTWTNGQSGHETEWKEAGNIYNGDTMKGDRHRFITSKIVSNTLWNAVGDAGLYKGKDYLPHIRVNVNGNNISDALIKAQSKYAVAIPVPEWTAGIRETITPLSLMAPANTYAVIYPADADKINIEFSQDLVDANGYFMLSYGNKQVDKQLIKKRVYTYTYDYQAGLKLQYGIADPDAFMTDMEAAGKVNGTDYMLEDIFDYPDEYYWEDFEPVSYKAAALARHVMTYGNEYYYIDEEGIVHGTGSTVRAAEEEAEEEAEEVNAGEEKGSITDESARTMPGSYITVYNGRALTDDGNIIDVESGTSLGAVDGINVLDNPVPLQSFSYDGFQVETYSRFTEVIGTDIVARENQILRGSTGVVGFVDGMIENVKDSILLYTKEGTGYQTILGADGIMVDMCQGEKINAPEDFRNSGIVYMTNNLSCSAPFVLVEYSNGGIVGYNYMTGEYLFDHSISNTMSLLDYARVYFDGDKSMYAQMSNTYAANKKVADIAGTPERLLTMVEGNSSGTDVEGNSEGKGTESEHEKSALSEEDGAKTGNNTAMSEGDTDNIKENGTEETMSEGEGKGDNQLTNSNEALGGSGGNGSAEGLDTDTAGLAGNADGGNDEDNGLKEGDTGLMAVPPADMEPMVGDGAGTGELVVAGDGAGDGKSPDSIAGETENLSEAGGASEKTDAPGADNAKTADFRKNDKKKEALETEEETAAEEMGGNSEAGSKQEEAAKETEEKASKPAEAEKKLSTAGTPTEESSGGINNGEKTKRQTPVNSKEEADQAPDAEDKAPGSEGELVTVYNQATGTYEIVDMKQYFSTPGYQSENVKLCIRDMSAYAGFAQKKEEKKHADGLVLYVLVAAAALIGVGLTIKYRKQHKLH